MSSTTSSPRGSPIIIPAIPKIDFVRERSSSISSLGSTSSIRSTMSVRFRGSGQFITSSSKKRKRARPRKRTRGRSASVSSTASAESIKSVESTESAESSVPGSLLGIGLSSPASEGGSEHVVEHGLMMETDIIDPELEENVMRYVPLPDRLKLMPTRKELKAVIETIDIYAVMIPSQSANDILNIIRSAIPPTKSILDLQHLRRLVRPENMPISVSGLRIRRNASSISTRTGSSNSSKASTSRSSSCVSSDGSGSNRIGSGSPAAKKRRRKSVTSIGDKPLFLLLCAVKQIEMPALYNVLAKHHLFDPQTATLPPTVTIHPVPLHPPSSQEQSDALSAQYWPTVYRRGNPFGPHPSLVERMETKLMASYADMVEKFEGNVEASTIPSVASQSSQTVAKYYMELARQTANDGYYAGHGLRIGAIVVDMTDNDIRGRVVAVAADARYGGNPLGHAIMRVIALVGRKRVEVAGKEPVLLPFDINQPLTPIEREHFGKSQLQKDGYLMHNLHVYVTHEPCVMCSMALLHSRTGLIVFGKAMKSTGGIHSDLAITTAPEPMSDDEIGEEFYDASEFFPYATSSPVSRSTSRVSRYFDALESLKEEELVDSIKDLQIDLARHSLEPHSIEIFETLDTEVMIYEGENPPDLSQFNQFDDYHTHQNVYSGGEQQGNTQPEDQDTMNPHSFDMFVPSKAGDDEYLNDQFFEPDDGQDKIFSSETDITEPERGRSRVPIHKPGKRDGYGLFWRDKLNWKFLAWQWQDADNLGEEFKWPDEIDEEVNA